MRNVNLLLKKDFKSAGLLTETSFFLYSGDRPKMAKESNQDVQSTSARVAKDASKKVAKAEVNLN